MRSLIKRVIPPVLLNTLRSLQGHGLFFEGSYKSWETAMASSGGYSHQDILQQVGDAALKVKRGEAVFERDSVCFHHEEYRWPTLACLLQVAAERQGQLRVLDFGGSLGSFYFQHRKFLNRLKKLRWLVVEQKHYVECGRSDFQDDVLRFFETIDECLASGPVDAVLCSGVLQYLERPYSVLEHLATCGSPYMLLDRTAFIDGEQDRLTVQHVPPSIYKASYPAWFFSRSQFDRKIQGMGFNVRVEFPCDDDVGIGKFTGLLLERVEGQTA